MTDVALAAQLRALENAGAGDPVGLALVRTLLERAEGLPPSGRARLVARAEALLETYATRVPVAWPAPRRTHDPAWRDALEARARQRPVRVEPPPIVSEIRAQKAVTRAVAQVPEVAGPYHGSTVAARALRELAELSPGYASTYVGLLEDLGVLLDFPDRRALRRKGG